jgi:hypothetical protein
METEAFLPAARMESAGARCQTRRVRCSPLVTGVLLAALAAVAFGVTTLIVAKSGRSVGPLATAVLLYLGAALSALVLQTTVPRGDAAVRRTEHRGSSRSWSPATRSPRRCLGLQHAGPTAGALLNREFSPPDLLSVPRRATDSGVDRGRSAVRR